MYVCVKADTRAFPVKENNDKRAGMCSGSDMSEQRGIRV